MTYLSSQQSDEQADSPVSSSSADGDSTLGEKKETANLHLHITITKAKSHKKSNKQPANIRTNVHCRVSSGGQGVMVDPCRSDTRQGGHGGTTEQL